jgi:CelD/BcsL family acetyltransferase involved in cellulose biosynthesis
VRRVRVDVVAPHELGAEEHSAWAAIQRSESELDSPFLTASFAMACARARPRTRVAVLRDDAGIAGFFAYEAGRAGSARALGQGLSDVQALVVPSTSKLDVPALLRACGLRTWQFDHLLGHQGPLLAGAPHRWGEDRSPVVDLGEGWDAYEKVLRTTSSSLRSTTARRRRNLERDHGPVSLEFSEPDHAILDQLIQWKSQQYRRTGRPDPLARPGVRPLLHDLLDTSDSGFAAPLAVLRAGDEIVAAHLGLRSAETLAWWFPVYVPRFHRYSPGLILCLDILRAMPGQGLRSLDLGKGDEPYKQRLANAEIPLLQGGIGRGPVSAGLGAALRWPRAQVKSLFRKYPDLREWSFSIPRRLARLRELSGR